MRREKVVIRIRVLGLNRKGGFSYKIYLPDVLSIDDIWGKLAELSKYWVPNQKAFYIREEDAVLPLIKIISSGIILWRKSRTTKALPQI